MIDGLGYGPATWLAYARGDFKTVDSLIEHYSGALNVQDLIEDMLLLVSIIGQVDYPIFILEKTAEHFPRAPGLHYHLARLYLE